MKKILLILCVLVSLCTQAQKNRVEHNLQASVGACDVLVDGQSESGLMIKLGYGLNYYFSKQWSVMPGVAYREVNERGLKTCLDGSDYDHFNFIDIPIIVHYYLGGDKGSWLTFGLGPVFSFCVGNDTYYINADPKDPRNGLEKAKSFSFGLQPSITCPVGKHWKFGVEAYLNLTDMQKKYENLGIKGSRHIHHFAATVGFIF